MLAGSLAHLFFFIGLYLVIAAAIGLLVGMLIASFFALVLVRFYVEAGLPADVQVPGAFADQLEIEGRRIHVSWGVIVGALAAAVVVVAVLANLLLKTAWTDRPILVFAHRGASAEAPENTLAAFTKGAEEGADYIELDVQESADGTVLVNHDIDLMKDGRSPLKVWDTPAAQLQAVDIGSSFSPAFADQRVPTLAAVLAMCKAKGCRIDIELKDYGHDQMLEQRVVDLVESAGMQDRIVTMSLSPAMVAKMKELRPQWTSGLLLAKAIGNPRKLPGDFVAVQKATATRRFVRAVHSTGRHVYVWTVDDPQVMLRYVGLGVDGLITNKPAAAREALANYASMTEAQRLLLYVMTYLGAEQEVTPPESELRP